MMTMTMTMMVAIYVIVIVVVVVVVVVDVDVDVDVDDGDTYLVVTFRCISILLLLPPVNVADYHGTPSSSSSTCIRVATTSNYR